jgi:hypothetical protein
LLQRLEAVVFLPRARPEYHWWLQQTMRRTASGWDIRATGMGGAGVTFTDFLAPGVRWQSTTGKSSETTLAESWLRFFPATLDALEGLPDSPGMRGFFRQYQEPIEDFFHSAAALTAAVEAIADARRNARPDDGPSPSEQAIDQLIQSGSEEAIALPGYSDPFEDAITRLNKWAGSISPHFTIRSSRTVEEQWRAPTLLASLAMLALRDLASGCWPRRCENVTCRRLYVSRAYQAQYCSERCRLTVNKRTYRQNKRSYQQKDARIRRAARRRRPRNPQ